MLLDHVLLDLLNRPGDATLDSIMEALSSRWLLVPLLLLAGYFIWQRTRWGWKYALVMVAAVAASDALAARVIKPAVARVRPCNEKPPRAHTVPSIGCGRGESFPSGHAANAAAAATVLSWAAPPLALFGMLAALLVGVSRIYLGAHWPTDVLGGYLLGALVGAALIRVARYLQKT